MTTATTQASLRAEWPAILREDGARMEIICPHGVGHPVRSLSPGPWKDWMGVHGCDGCCRQAIFALAEIAHGGRPSRDVKGCDHKFVDSRVCIKCGWSFEDDEC